MHRTFLPALAIALCAPSALGQTFSDQGPCSYEPEWRGVCSFYRAFDPGIGPKTGYLIRELRSYSWYEHWLIVFPTVATDIEVLITTRLHREHAGKVVRLIANAVAVLPDFVLRSLPPNVGIEIDYVNNRTARYNDRPDERSHRIKFDASFVSDERTALHHRFEELLLHEIAHVFDRLYGLRDLETWQAAVERDGGKYITEYAETGGAGEDFAESFAAWVAYRREGSRGSDQRLLGGEHYDRVRTHMLNRLRWFDNEYMRIVRPDGRLFERYPYTSGGGERSGVVLCTLSG